MVATVTDAAPDEPMILEAAFVQRWVREAADQIASNRDYLTQLDAAIGDADHGINMDRGFSAAAIDLDAAMGLPPGEILNRVGSTLVYRVGGAAGPLFGTCFRSAATSLGEEPAFEAEDLLKALRSGLDGIQGLGAAEEGDKTIVDAYVPALQAFERALRSGGDVTVAAHRAADAAKDGMRATVPLQARKGRASYLGPRSVGHQDPGATSTALLFTALARALDARTT
jgi:phosphoenolpyruvate---glycerone phosphotransferase subunit DhaL